MYFHCLKSRSVFLIGFGIGFIVALLLVVIQDVYNVIFGCTKCSLYQDIDAENIFPKLYVSKTEADKAIRFQHWQAKGNTGETANATYSKWLKDQNLKICNLNMDEHLYSSRIKNELESDWAKRKIHITCVVFVQKIKLATSIKNTWSKRCNDIYFFSQHLKDPIVPVIKPEIKLVSSWQLLCESLNYIWNRNKNIEWLIIVKDDTLVIPENLRYVVAPLNHMQDHYLGHAVLMWGQAYNVAQAGYVISKGVLTKLMEKFNNSEKCLAGGKYWKKEDYYLAKHLSSMGIHPSDTRDQYLRGTFHGYSLQNLLWGVVKPGSYWTHALYPLQEQCCSPLSVTFSVAESDKLYTFDYFLYHLYVLKRNSVFGARKAPISVPEDDVWKVALKEEFNITYLNEISSDAYYEIWHSKYSEPEQLIAKNYKSMPDVLSSVLTAYELESKMLDKSGTK